MDAGSNPPDNRRAIRRVVVVLNSKAGALLDSDDPERVIREAFAAAGLETTFVPLDAGSLPQRIEQAAASGADAIVVAGGDGTVACAAAALRGADVPLAILPSGTMNLLAKDLNLPIGDLPAAVSVVAGGVVRAIDVGEVNGHVFLCASMLGLPARLGRTREETRGSGLRTWSRMAAAAWRQLVRARRLRVMVVMDRQATPMRASALTITVNPVDERCGRALGRTALDGGQLCLYVIERLGPRALLGLVRRLLLRQRDPTLGEHVSETIDISSRRRAMRVMNDGELRLLELPLRYRLHPRALQVLVPPV